MSADAKRQLGIKTRSVKRLAADVKSYLVEKSSHQSRLDQLSAQPGAESHELRRAREFVEEAESTIQDVRQRLQEAYQGLEKLMEEVEAAGDADVLADQSFVDARKMLEEVAPLVTVVADEHKDRGFKVAVFGSSQLTDDDAAWRPTEELGEKLARASYHVLSGGYSGTSEAVSFGASRVAQSKVEGVLCPAAYPTRVPNQYLSIESTVADPVERTHAFVKHTDAFVVMPGGLGTLHHLVTAWHLSSLEQSQSKPPLCILVWQQPWQSLLESLAQPLKLPQGLLQSLKFVSSVDGIMQELEQMKAHKRASRVGLHGAAASSSQAPAPTAI